VASARNPPGHAASPSNPMEWSTDPFSRERLAKGSCCLGLPLGSSCLSRRELPPYCHRIETVVFTMEDQCFRSSGGSGRKWRPGEAQEAPGGAPGVARGTPAGLPRGAGEPRGGARDRPGDTQGEPGASGGRPGGPRGTLGVAQGTPGNGRGAPGTSGGCPGEAPGGRTGTPRGLGASGGRTGATSERLLLLLTFGWDAWGGWGLALGFVRSGS